MAESENIPTLIELLRLQQCDAIKLSCYFCVNQPDDWHDAPGGTFQSFVVNDNAVCLDMLYAVSDMAITVIDKSSKGNGWSSKWQGVGWARKLLFDRICAECAQDTVIVSLDADTAFRPDYLCPVAESVSHHLMSALAVPYYHTLGDSEQVSRATIRYECYMRHYLMSLLRIHNPYAFTALGSAMAFTVKGYLHAGGISPLQGGEDFYLLQKFAKTGGVVLWAGDDVCVFPQGRISHRVPFGTGPAVALELSELELKYPFYAQAAFDEVRKTFEIFPLLYDSDIETPMSAFLREQLKCNDLWEPLRRNFKSRELFVRACQQRVDGLRILQYLKYRDYPSEVQIFEGDVVDFHNDDISRLDAYRNYLTQEEYRLRRLSVLK